MFGFALILIEFAGAKL